MWLIKNLWIDNNKKKNHIISMNIKINNNYEQKLSNLINVYLFYNTYFLFVCLNSKDPFYNKKKKKKTLQCVIIMVY